MLNVPPASELLSKPEKLQRGEFQFLLRQAQYNEVLLDAAELKRRIRFHPNSGSPASTPKTGVVDAGVIRTLPAEGIINILRHTTISSLLTLRRANSTIKSIIDQWKPFQLITNHGDDTVRALVATGAGHLWTAGQLVNVLFTTKCELCGEHGEIIHLLKLKRCCFRCLSEARELLAVEVGYATKFLGLSREELETLPTLTTFPQNMFWGFPSVPCTMVDYEAAMKLSGDRVLESSPNHGTLAMFPYKFRKTGVFLDKVFRSVQPRPTKRVYERRGQPSMKLAPSIIRSPETHYWQHACAVQQRAMTRKLARLADGTFKDSVTIVNAVYCEGCARFWNYHSPLPFYFHKMYTHNPAGGPTEFTNHLKHCVYAQAHWTRIECPWYPVQAARKIFLLNNNRQIMWVRNPSTTLRESNAKFESIPKGLLNLVRLYSKNFRNFQQPYSWPQPGGGGLVEGADAAMLKRVKEREKKASRLHHTDDDIDLYWDMLVGPEAASQTNWACANLYDGSSTLFRGPVSLLESKRLRLIRKAEVKNHPALMKESWGFDRF